MTILTTEQEAYLRAAWVDKTITRQEIADRLGVVEQTTTSIATRLGLGPKLAANNIWSDDRVAELKRLHGLGLGGTEIAKKLGGVTRTAVVAKCWRLGLARPKASKPAKPLKAPPVKRDPWAASGVQMKGAGNGKPALVFTGPQATLSTKPKAPFHDVKGGAFDALPGSKPIPWTERLSGMCAWPVDGGEDEQLSCAEACGENTYCPTHLWWRKDKNKPPAKASELVRSLRRYAA